MHLVAGHAGHGGLVSETVASDVPGAGRVLRLHKIADCAVEVHSVAAEAIVHQPALGVVHGIGEYLRVGSAVGTSMPTGVLVLMAFLTTCGHCQHVDVAKPDGFGSVAAEMYTDVTQFGGEARFVAIETSCSAMWRAMDGARICGHLVTTGATLAVLRCVVVRRAVSECNGQDCDRCENEASELEVAHHERNAVPFQLRTSEAEA